MKIFNLIFFVIFFKFHLYRPEVIKYLEARKEQNVDINQLSKTKHKKPCQSNAKSSLHSEIPTQITIVKNTEIIFKCYKHRALDPKLSEYKSTNYSTLLKIAKNSFEEKIVNTFIYRLNSPSLLLVELNKAISLYPKRTINICSSFEISKMQKQKLLTIIRKKINASAKVKFQLGKEFDFGIELQDYGYKIFSNLEYYLIELDTKTEIINKG